MYKSHLDCIFMWNVFSSSGLATFLPRVALISVWLALSCITSAIHCNTQHQYTAAAAYSNGEVNIALSTLCVDLSMGLCVSQYLPGEGSYYLHVYISVYPV